MNTLSPSTSAIAAHTAPATRVDLDHTAPMATEITTQLAPNPRLPATPKTSLECHYDETALLSTLSAESKLLPLAETEKGNILARVTDFISGKTARKKRQRKAEHTLRIIAQHLSGYSNEQRRQATVDTIKKSIEALLPPSKSQEKQQALQEDIQTALVASQTIDDRKNDLIDHFQLSVQRFVHSEVIELSRILPVSTQESIFKKRLLQAIEHKFEHHEIHQFAPELFHNIVNTTLQTLSQSSLQEAQDFVTNETQALEQLEIDIGNTLEKSLQSQLENHCYDTAILKENALNRLNVTFKDNLVFKSNPTLFRNTARAIIQSIDLEQKIQTTIELEQKIIEKIIDKQLLLNTNTLIRTAMSTSIQNTITDLTRKIRTELEWGLNTLDSQETLDNVIAAKLAEFNLDNKVTQFKEHQE